MSTTAGTAVRAQEKEETDRSGDLGGGIPRWVLVIAVVVAWVALWSVFRGQDTLVLRGRDSTPLHDDLTGFRDAVLASRDTNPVIGLTTAIAEGFRNVFDFLQRLVSVPAFPRPVPQVGWLGVTALAAWVALAVANWRISLLVTGTFLAYGLLGFWSDSIDLLLVTGLAVFVTVLIGMPLAVAVGTSRRAKAVITPVLDAMQTMPTFVYLIPVVLFFGIGVSGAVVCTLVYALPPLIRIGGYGISAVSTTTIEATDSTGQTSWQRLLKVQLPMARKTIIVGLNQTTMAALSMAIIASYVNGPGLGKPVLQGLIRNDVGSSLVPGLLIVLTAIMLDRTTTAASERADLAARGHGLTGRTRQVLLAVVAVVALVCVYLSRTVLDLAEFPETGWGTSLANGLDSFVGSVVGALDGPGEVFKNAVTYGLLNPMQSLLAESPWWLAALAIALVAAALGGLRALLPAVVCLAGIWFFDLWNDAMVTLNMVLVATILVMLIAIVFGVWMARSHRVDVTLRPLLDAGQTIPAFVYLIPVLALFGSTRFTAIVAALVYAAPAAIKLVADGVKAVPETTLEASRSTGTTSWQEITQVQLPMARGSLVLAANQGLLYVLAMVVIGGLVGAGALGYDVVLGFSRSEEWGKGAAAGLTIVLLGIMLDRIGQRAAARTGEGVKVPLRRPSSAVAG
ncbi:glycine betaine/proline transport system permease protein [Nocardioides scoriae]|uniref:Glycine betaine/proline transport system permease protein n=1 Tax=Nocardioides scoriae TaxID=642780 RepID=A0A1H1UPI2_9ACTN|nr:ABC transporter permease subunit [Nocardioides scoriae]SDS74190.1 glycine betaine/proline transport system permease protein [Nocardioides scoriae]